MNENATQERPTLVTVLCILTWIGSGLGLLFTLLILILGAAFLGSLGRYMPGAAAGGMVFMLLLLVAHGATLFGALQMWNMKKMGFYIYAGGQVLFIISPLLFGGSFSATGLFFPALFIGLYGMNLKNFQD